MRIFVDGTLGAGGHSAAVLTQHPNMQLLVGIDKDPVAHSIAQKRLEQAKMDTQSGVTIRHVLGDFRGLKGYLNQAEGGAAFGAVSGILLDLGMSSMQVDTAERGFSFAKDGPLDMRMGPSALASAEEIVNSWSEAALGRIFREYGEERAWRRLASKIVEVREEKTIRTTLQLAAAIGFHGKKDTSALTRWPARPAPKRIHPATRVFQALRIAVNDELGALEAAIPDAIEALEPGGRLAIISFHSLEDRAVKWAFLRAAGRATPEEEEHGPRWQMADVDGASERRPAVGRILTKKPLLAQEQEAALNPRSRSAKLRVLEKL
ncbi:Ribosomal RNA small subunit methyltransferase H [Coccomyxa sp. Obi]|nr:Ribosomal RNA small subunit methyltransferase H [Coccomyxa sp. Obi]